MTTIYLSLCLSVYLSLCLSVCLSICLSIRQSICKDRFQKSPNLISTPRSAILDLSISSLTKTGNGTSESAHHFLGAN